MRHLLPLFLATAAHAAAVTVSTEIELRDAAKRIVAENTTIVIAGTIRTDDQIVFPASPYTVKVVGVRTTSTVQFRPSFTGDWSKAVPRNGFEFNNANAVLYGFTIRDYGGLGSAVKGHGSGSLIVDHCSFFDCAATSYPPRVEGSRSSADFAYGQVIGSNYSYQSIVVSGCTFRRCATSSWQWAHVLYTRPVPGGVLVVTDNEFDECNNPFALSGDPGKPAIMLVAGNKATRPKASPDTSGRLRPVFYATLKYADDTAFVRNTLSGVWGAPWVGEPLSATQHIDGNDYSGAGWAEPWFAIDTTRGKYISIDEWRKAGMDATSKWPPTP